MNRKKSEPFTGKKGRQKRRRSRERRWRRKGRRRGRSNGKKREKSKKKRSGGWRLYGVNSDNIINDNI